MMEVRFHPAAEIELAEAAAYYEEQRRGLGNALVREVRTATELLSLHPEAAPRILGAVRRKVVKRFPYSILYSIESWGLYILALAHQSRRPDYWTERLREPET